MERRKASRGPADPWQTALRLLARRDYGIEELRSRLQEKGFPPEAVELAIARGVGLGYLDDARYVERLTRTLLDSGRAVGPRLTLELRRRGLPADLIAAASAAARTAAGEEAALRDLLARRFPAFDFAGADAKGRRRVIHFLQRRGFSLDRILTELKRNDT